MNFRILAALLRKEIKLMKRNPIIPKIMLIMPVMVMLVLPLIATMDVRNVNIAVVDNDRSILSRRIISDMDATDELTVRGIYGTHDEAIMSVEKGETAAVVTIPPHWERDMSQIDIDANGVNSIKGMLGARYVSESVMTTLAQWRTQNGMTEKTPDVTVANRYNPTLNFPNFMIPALMVILLNIMCGFVPTLNLVSEKEEGTIEAINVTPVDRMTFVLSKLIPFWIAGILVVTIGMVIGMLVYGLRPEGSVWAIYLATILFSLFMSALGVTVANKSATMLQSIFIMFAFVIIFQLMGGLFTPISSMPQWALIITYAIPPRYFNEIMRAIYLKGASVADLWTQFACLGSIAAALCAVAAFTYHKRS